MDFFWVAGEPPTTGVSGFRLSVCFYFGIFITRLSAADVAASCSKTAEATHDRFSVAGWRTDAERTYSIKICRALAWYKFRFLAPLFAADRAGTVVVDFVLATSVGSKLFTDKRAAATTHRHAGHGDGLGKLSATKTPCIPRNPERVLLH